MNEKGGQPAEERGKVSPLKKASPDGDPTKGKYASLEALIGMQQLDVGVC